MIDDEIFPGENLPRNPTVCALSVPPRPSGHQAWYPLVGRHQGRSRSGRRRWSCRCPLCWEPWTSAPPPPRRPERWDGRAEWWESGSSCPRYKPTWRDNIKTGGREGGRGVDNLPELLFIVSVVRTVNTVRHSGFATQGLLAPVHSFLEPEKQNYQKCCHF